MDSLIKRFDVVADDDLLLCEHRGVAYQRNMARGRIPYDAAYFEHFRSYAGSATENALNAGRCAMVARHAPAGAKMLDIGIGSGAFVQAAAACGFHARGFDINAQAVTWLKNVGFYADDPREFDVLTFWDSIEHIEDPQLLLKNVQRGALLFAAIPVFEDLRQVRASKHYKPGEHLYYWTSDGFVEWMALRGFRLLERSSHETDAGRESIGAFAFRRDLPGFRDYIGAYTEMHASRHYGNSATELHLNTVAKVVFACEPTSILDYGCGRSDLVAHFWRDGERTIARYDPAIPGVKQLPEGIFDLVLCCDVLEHIPMAGVDRVLEEVRGKSSRAFFTISLKLARARLPDGQNAHVTLLTKGEWSRWITDYFGRVHELPSHSEHELVLLAGPRVEALRAAA